MKLKYLAIALFPLTLAACQSSDIQKVGDLAMSVLQQQNPTQALSHYEWRLNTANAPKPIVLNFTENGQLAISTSCNSMNGTWKLSNGSISTGNLASTMMACPDSHMAQEGIAAGLFHQRLSPYALDLSNTEAPTLTITDAKGKKLIFKGVMTPEYKYKSAGETIFLEINPETKPCIGVGKQTCLQVREIKYSDSGVKTQVDKDWTLFYDNIEGFNHTPNERQVIRVKRFELKNPAADQSKYAYIYDMSIERGAIDSSL